MTIDEFLKACGRMHRTDVNVGFSRAPLSEITYFWLDRGDRWVRTHVTGLELIQNAVQYELMQGPEYEPGCNPRCRLEHPKGFDTLHVGPNPDVVFKMGHENDGTPYGRLGADGTPHCGRCARARRSIAATERRAVMDFRDNRLKETEARLAADIHALILKSASKQLAPSEVEMLYWERQHPGWQHAGRMAGDAVPRAPLDPPPPQPVGEWLTGAPAVAVMDKAGRQQLRMLVNEKLPAHLLGAPINSVKEALMGNAVEVTIAGDEGGYLLMEKELDAAGLTVTKAVALWR